MMSMPSTPRSARPTRSTDRPTLICCKTIIGKGSPNRAGTDLAHGQALGEKEVALTREALGWTLPAVRDPAGDLRRLERARERAPRWSSDWNARFARVPGGASGARRRIRAPHRRTSCPAPSTNARAALVQQQNEKAETDRHAQGIAAGDRGAGAGAAGVDRRLGRPDRLRIHQLVGQQAAGRRATTPGNYINFGVREFAMSAIANGLALHGGFIPYVGTFLTFSDYARNALRMAALMKLRSISVYTHDSIGLGEDGPTHQSVEHASSLRLIPNLDVWRPCDTVESALAWIAAIERQRRADVPAVHAAERVVQRAHRRRRSARSAAAATCCPMRPRPRAVIIATGSEVALAIGAQKALADAGIPVRVVSMPCTSVFDRQDAAWRESVLPRGVPRVAVEAGVSDFWRKYVGAVDDPAAPWSASIASANPRRPPCCSSISGSPSSRSWRR